MFNKDMTNTAATATNTILSNRANPFISSSIAIANEEAAYLRANGITVEVLFLDQHPVAPAGAPVWEVWAVEAETVVPVVYPTCIKEEGHRGMCQWGA